jgi:hypothetical protein
VAVVHNDPAAVKLPFGTGEYLCTWKVPDRDKGSTEVPGMLTVEPGRVPRGLLYGKMPIAWIGNGSSRVASFPQRHEFRALTGRLSTGAHIALMNGELSYWLETQGRAVGAFAVLSQQEFDNDEHRRYGSIELQIEGLEALCGVAPISSTTIPGDKTSDQVWAATVDADARLEWRSGPRTMTFWYSGSFRSFDAYEFRMVFGPVLRLATEEPLTVAEWWLNWVRPLRQLVSLATRAPREIRYLLASNAEGPRSLRDQVFGWDITQEPVNSTRAAIEETRSSLNLKGDDVSLLDLLEKWRELEEAHHPLIETYGVMATAEDQHPRSRFLLLLQAIEGAHGFENLAEQKVAQEKYSLKRAEFLERAKGVLSEQDYRFAGKRLMKAPPQGLEQALIAVFKRLPISVLPELEKSQIVAQVRKEHGQPKMRVENALVKVRNALSHGSAIFPVNVLREAALILDRVVSSEGLRVLGAPVDAQARALAEPEH